jgi:hypothetical protein
MAMAMPRMLAGKLSIATSTPATICNRETPTAIHVMTRRRLRATLNMIRRSRFLRTIMSYLLFTDPFGE